MDYIGKESALKRMAAYLRRNGEERFQIDEQIHHNADSIHLITQLELYLYPDEFMMFSFTTLDNESILLSSRRFFLFDNQLNLRFLTMEDIQEVKFNYDFKSNLEASYAITLDLSNQPSLVLLMPNGPDGISLINAIRDIRRTLYE